MFLYHLTLQRPGGISQAVVGSFSAPKVQELIVARGDVLELLRPDESGKVQTVHSTPVFGCIRAIAAFRLTGANRDHVVIASDSGRIVIASYNKEHNRFDKIHQETYGKSGARRVVPGQYLAVDPKGRAVMVAAVEKSKLVYVLNRDAAASLTISSPLEAHKSHTLCFALTALDMGFENPVFAAIELDYGDADADPTGVAAAEATKHLTLYELDLGLNHVVRKWSEPCDNGANLLVAVPGGGDGPGGVLLCSENFVSYKAVGRPDCTAIIPRRGDLPGERGVLLTSAAAHRTRDGFFFLLQSEYGDIYKATLVYTGESVSELVVRYFDTLPPAASLAVFRAGFLFAASEWGNHGFYQFTGVGDAQDDVASSSAALVETEEGFAPVFFEPRPLRNLLLLDDVASLAPITALIPLPGAPADAPALLAACGSGPRSKLAALRPGVAVTELAVSPLPAAPTAVWTVRRSVADPHHAYIVVAFANATVVLGVGEAVEEVHDSGFVGSVPSLAVGLMADDSLVQVHPGGVRHVRPDKRATEWRAPGRKTVVRCALNARQVLLALSGGELVYFELDAASGALNDVERRDLGGDVACLDVGPVPEGRLRARFAAVGAYDSTVRVLSLDPEDCLQVLAVQALAVAPESLLLLDMGAGEGDADVAAAGGSGDVASAASSSLFLAVGLSNGVLLRTEVDRVTGQLSDTRRRVLGHKPPRLAAVALRGRPALLALSSRPWLGHSEGGGRFSLAPLAYDHLLAAAPFHSEAVGEGVVALARDATLRVFAVERATGDAFHAQPLPLRYTPRALAPHPTRPLLAVAEADAGVLPPPPGATRDGPPDADAPMTAAAADDDAEAEAPAWSAAEQFGLPRGGPGSWASCVRLVDTKAFATTALIELPPGEAALCATCCQFPNYPEVLLAVGIAVGLQFAPARVAAGGALALYRFPPEGGLELLHRTPLDVPPTALAPFQGGRLLAGCGRALRLYDLGKKKLLRKCEAPGFPNAILTLHSAGERIYAGDAQESVHFVRYKAEDNAFYVFADDTAPRWVVAAQPLDYDTVAVADKFGSVAVLRLAGDAAEEAEEDPSGGRVHAGAGALGGAPHKLDATAVLHVGAPARALCRAALQPGGAESLLFGSVLGAVGALLPFTQREDVDFAQTLELHMRQEAPPLSGRDHLAYRSSYWAVKDVVDGDLCERFGALPPASQRRIADDMERTSQEVLKKLEDLRARII